MTDYRPEELIARIDELLAAGEEDLSVSPDAMRWTGEDPPKASDEEIDSYYFRVLADELDLWGRVIVDGNHRHMSGEDWSRMARSIG